MQRASEPDILLFVKPSTLHAVELLTEANKRILQHETDRQLLTHSESPIFNIGCTVSFANHNKMRELVTSF